MKPSQKPGCIPKLKTKPICHWRKLIYFTFHNPAPKTLYFIRWDMLLLVQVRYWVVVQPSAGVYVAKLLLLLLLVLGGSRFTV